MNIEKNNRQVRKTRDALLAAFGQLVLERRYPEIRVADILRVADVGRSTFYEHFRSKDDLLRESISGVLESVAATVTDECDVEWLQHTLEHFRDHARLARGLINGPSAPQVVTALASLIQIRLEEQRLQTVIPIPLVALQTAESQLGLIRAWLNSGSRCPAAAVAAAMQASAVASTRSLVREKKPKGAG